MSLRRRELLTGSAALLVVVALPGVQAAGVADPAPLRASAFIRIGRDGWVTLVMSKAEMGQGIHTAFAQLLAEELDVSLARVRVENAPADDTLYGDPGLGGLQMTGGSTSVRASWLAMRQAGADARQLLRQAAAQRWKVGIAEVTTGDGHAIDAARHRRLAYGALVATAATLPMPNGAPLKPVEDFKLVGRPHKRLDSRAKVEGRERFGIDVHLASLKHAAVAACPVFGGRLAAVDETAARRVAGVRQVVRLDDAVAVIADNTWAAQQGLAAAAPQWHAGEHAAVDSAGLAAQLDRAASAPGAVAVRKGNPEAALAAGTRRIDAVYRAPLLAHATLEPMNCTVQVGAGRVVLWLGTQVPTRAQAVAARVAGVPPERVTVHNLALGGGFGRRLEVDYVEQAVRIARQVAGPVKVLWSREEDIQHDMYRPLYHDTLAAVLGSDGMPIAWTHRITASSIIARFFPPLFKGVDGDAIEGAAELPYTLPAMQVDYVRCEPAAVPTAFWRGVGPTHNGFVVEGFVDELAAAAGQDPVAYRRALLHDARARGVLDLAAAKAGWGQPMPAGQGRGVALLHAFGSYVAQVAEVAVAADGNVRVLRVVCAIDCGLPINPSTIAAQMEGGIVFGLSAGLWGEVTLAEGRVLQSNFHDYRVMRLNETPRIEVHIVPSREAPGGVGEPGTSAAIPALVNAVHDATGRRIRSLPIASQLSRGA